MRKEVRRAFGRFLAAVAAAGFTREDVVFVDFAATDPAASPDAIKPCSRKHARKTPARHERCTK